MADVLSFGVKVNKRAASNSSEKIKLVNKIDNKSQSPLKPKLRSSYRMDTGTPSNQRSPNSKFGGPDECTRINYKTGELKMEKYVNRSDNNVFLYYKNKQVLFKGTVISGTSTIEEGAWNYENGQLYYKGEFNKQGVPEGENCTLYNEDGSIKFVGSIEKSNIDVNIPAKRLTKKPQEEGKESPTKSGKEIKKVKIKIDPGKISIFQLTRHEIVEIPKEGIMFAWKRENLSDSRFVNQAFQDYEEFVYCGTIKNGYIEGKGKLYYLESDAKAELDDLMELEVKSKKSHSSSRVYSSSNRNLKATPTGNTLDVPVKSNAYGSSSNIKRKIDSSDSKNSKCHSPQPSSMLRDQKNSVSGNKSPLIKVKMLGDSLTPEKKASVNDKTLSTPQSKLTKSMHLNNTAPNQAKMEVTGNGNYLKVNNFNANDDNLSTDKTPCSDIARKMTDGSSEEKYKHQLFYEGEFSHGLIHGKVKFQKISNDEEPQPIFTGSMDEGLLNGNGRYFYPSGKKFLIGFWENDLMIGDQNCGFYETGLRFFEGLWDNEGGRSVKIFDRNGKSVQYKGTTYPLDYSSYKLDWFKGTSFDRGTGKRRCIGTWVNGKLNGDGVEIYDNLGVLMSIANYKEGLQNWSKEWNKEGKLKLEANWHNNRWQGMVRKYGPSEELIYEGIFGNGQKDGFGTEYWDIEATGGKPLVKKIEGTYKRGKLYGEHIQIFNKDELLKYSGGIKNDLKEGPGSIYHKNGILEMTCMWNNDKPNDSFVRVFSSEGFPIYEGTITKGFRKGFGRMWDMRGKLKCVGWFEGNHHYNRNKPGWNCDHVGKLVEYMGEEVK